MSAIRPRPEFLEDDYLVYLDELRESGITNMWGAAPYVQREFGLSRSDARVTVLYWMESFELRHPEVTRD